MFFLKFGVFFNRECSIYVVGKFVSRIFVFWNYIVILKRKKYIYINFVMNFKLCVLFLIYDIYFY